MAYKSKHTGQQIDDAVDKAIQHEFTIGNLQKAAVTMNAGITANAEALANQAKELETKAPSEGYAPDLKVDFAKELVGRGVAEAQEIGTIRPTGVISIGDGNATIERVKGKSVVWNQLIQSWQVTSGGVNISYDGDKATMNGTVTAGYIWFCTSKKLVADHKGLLIVNVIKSTGIFEGLRVGFTNKTNIYSIIRGGRANIFYTYDSTFPIFLAVGIQSISIGTPLQDEVLSANNYDLTQMFGAGNEPTTIEEFESRRPLGVSDNYNEGEIISYDGGKELKSVGFNAFNGTYAKVIGGQQYHALGTITSIGFTTDLGGETTDVTLDSEGMFTPTETGYVYAVGTDICIHLTHTYTPEHTTEYEEDTLQLPNIKAIKDKDGNQLFPYGLLSAGSAHDEITATKAVKRIGVVDLGMLTYAVDKQRMSSKEYVGAKGYASAMICNTLCALYTPDTTANTYNNHINDKAVSIKSDGQISIYDSSYTDPTTFKQAMQGVLLYYELAEPIEVDLPEPLNLTYEAWDFGTEELIAEGATTPLNADIVYQFNAVDRIRENTAKNQALEMELAELKAQLTQLTQVSNEDSNA